VKQMLTRIDVPIETLHVARELYSKNEKELEIYIDLLLEWNDKINLVSRAVSRETIREHVVHSLIPSAMELTLRHGKWIDSGTGGGLPGIPLAICEKDGYWDLNDNVKKKMKAVEGIVKSLGLKNVEVIPKSISLVDLKKGTGIITKHAFKIDDLLRLIGSKPWKSILMWKGVDGAIEELSGSKRKLKTTIFAFDFGSDESFYEGKGLVLIER